MSVLASCQGTGGRVCYSSVAVICLREVQSKLVQTAQPGSASWVNMQLRRGLHTTESSWPPLQSVLCWNADIVHNLKSQWCIYLCVCGCQSWILPSLELFLHTHVKSFAHMLLAYNHICYFHFILSSIVDGCVVDSDFSLALLILKSAQLATV